MMKEMKSSTAAPRTNKECKLGRGLILTGLFASCLQFLPASVNMVQSATSCRPWRIC